RRGRDTRALRARTSDLSSSDPAATLTTSAADDNARITFGGTAGQRVFVNLTSVSIGSSSCCSLLASILKPDGSTMSGTTKYVGKIGRASCRATLPTTGMYTISH